MAANNDNHELYVGGSSLKLRKGMFQTMDLFQKNKFAEKNHDSHSDRDGIRKTLMMMKRNGGGGGGGGGDGIRRTPLSVPLISLQYFGGSRPLSLLEESLFPGFKQDVRLPIPSSGDQTETAQMTIFYAGSINVYDNVPADKAQAIMLLANQLSVSPPPVQNVTKKLDIVAKPIPQFHSPSLANAPEDLPIARRYSLRRFLEKRRGRMVNKSPYASS
ncbi:hypothetical protein ACH5RR_022608 [Cinchona calisaya]|uniref:Protein TIFY n=1 Tax=Cinchona calisaya TaxID=153742 RepID=A0ABD2Z893_9GENT